MYSELDSQLLSQINLQDTPSPKDAPWVVPPHWLEQNEKYWETRLSSELEVMSGKSLLIEDVLGNSLVSMLENFVDGRIWRGLAASAAKQVRDQRVNVSEELRCTIDTQTKRQFIAKFMVLLDERLGLTEADLRHAQWMKDRVRPLFGNGIKKFSAGNIRQEISMLDAYAYRQIEEPFVGYYENPVCQMKSFNLSDLSDTDALYILNKGIFEEAKHDALAWDADKFLAESADLRGLSELNEEDDNALRGLQIRAAYLEQINNRVLMVASQAKDFVPKVTVNKFGDTIKIDEADRMMLGNVLANTLVAVHRSALEENADIYLDSPKSNVRAMQDLMKGYEAELCKFEEKLEAIGKLDHRYRKTPRFNGPEYMRNMLVSVTKFAVFDLLVEPAFDNKQEAAPTLN